MGDFRNVDQLLGAGLIAALLYVLIGQSSGFYDLRAAFSKRKDAGRIFAQWSLVSLLLALFAFLMKSGALFSRGSIICFGLLALFLLLLSRRIAKRLVASAVTEGQAQGRRAIALGRAMSSQPSASTSSLSALASRKSIVFCSRVTTAGSR